MSKRGHSRNMNKNNDYLKEFVEAQENQYTQWKYISRGEPTPDIEASGNAMLAAIFWLIASAVTLVGAILLCFVTSSAQPLVMFPFGALFLMVGIGYIRRDRERKKASRASRQANRRKRKKRDK